jgi:hypothetical protein
MDFTPIITIVISAVAIYFFIKLIVNPLIKVIGGIVIFLIIIYIMQHFFGLDLKTAFGPFGKYLDPAKWNINFNEITTQAAKYVKKLFSL